MPPQTYDPSRMMALPGNGPANDQSANIPNSPGQFHVYTQLPITGLKVDWSKSDVDDALASHEIGNFYSSALLAEYMTRDDTFDAVLSTRVLGLLGLERMVQPSPTGDREANAQISTLIDRRFDDLFPRSALATILRWGILQGFSVAQIVWKPDEEGNEWVPELQPWHPLYVYYRLDTNTYVAITSEGNVDIIPGTGQWLLYTPMGRNRGWMSGAVRSVAMPWLARAFGWRDWQRFTELYSLGIRKLISPDNAGEPDKRKMFNAVSALGNETTMLLPQGTEGRKWDLDVLFPPSSGSAEGFEKLMNKCESRMAIRILGQNLTTEVKSGSHAAARVHERVRLDLLEADARTIGDCLRSDVLNPYVAFHPFPDDAEPPIVGWNTAPPEDRQTNANTFYQVGQAVAQLTTAGVQVDLKALAEQYEIPVVGGISTIPQPPPAGGGGNGGPSKPAPPSPPDGNKGPPPHPPGSAPQPTSRVALARKRVKRDGAVAGQLYVDDVVDAIVPKAKRAIAPTVRAVLDAIDSGESYADLRKRLKVSVKKADPTALARVMKDAMHTSHLAGRDAVIQDL